MLPLFCLARTVLMFMLGLVMTADIGSLRCFAQTSTAQVSGTVRDPSGAAIAGAQIKITQVETKQARQIMSDDQGRYVAPALPVGPYELEVTAAGFKTSLQSGILLQVGNNIDINVSMLLPKPIWWRPRKI